MNTNQLDHAIRGLVSQLRYPQNVFRGVFPVNHIPISNVTNGFFPAAFIINTDPSNLEGEHWVAIYIPAANEPAEYFDSYGQGPQHENIKRVLAVHPKGYIYNSQRFQSLYSTVCGHYCLFFLFCRLQNISFDFFLKCFSAHRHDLNDTLTRNIVMKYFSILPSSTDRW